MSAIKDTKFCTKYVLTPIADIGLVSFSLYKSYFYENWLLKRDNYKIASKSISSKALKQLVWTDQRTEETLIFNESFES